MARIRSVKPELRTSYLVASWPMEVRFFWVLFWGYLDDYGRGLDIPKTIAGDCFPHDDIEGKQIDEWLTLMGRGLDGEPGPVCRYTVRGKRYVHAVNWHEHQKPNRPTKSRIPPCPSHESLSEPVTEECSEPARESLHVGAAELGAAEVGSRGAGEQQHRLSEPPDPKPAAAAERFILESTDATTDEAAQLAQRIAADRKPRNLPGLVKTMAVAGDLKPLLDDLRIAAARTTASARLAAARDGPRCQHDVPGGEALHPASEEPICPQCRFAARQHAA